MLSALVAGACAPAEQTLDKRGSKLAKLQAGGIKENGEQQGAVPDPPEQPVKVDPPRSDDEPAAVTLPIPEAKLPALKLSAAKDLESIRTDDVILISKTSPKDFVIFGKDGKSWSYNPAASVSTDILKPIEAVVVAPEGSTLFSLPNQQFWFVSPDKLGRHKPPADGAAVDEKSITVEQFPTSTFKGDLSKIKVLYVSLEEVIFHLDSYIAIISVKTSPAQIKQLPIANLPVDLSGTIQAGRTNSGYWFKTKNAVYFLAATETEGVSPWTKSSFSVEPGDLLGYGMWPDATGTKYEGTSLGMSTTALYSNVVTQPAALK